MRSTSGNQAASDDLPYLGLQSFGEAEARYYFGREGELEELARRVERNRCVVLFARTGLGKTSLVRAGLFPRLRTDGFLPLYVRFSDALEEPPLDQLRNAVDAELRSAEAAGRIVGVGAPGDETLWEFFRNTPLWTPQNTLLRPVLVLDQFEELFTVVQRRYGAEHRDRLIEQLFQLVEGRVPDAVRARGASALARDPAPLPNVLICLREDFLAELDGLARQAPSLVANRLRLVAMSEAQAQRAIVGPSAVNSGKPLFDDVQVEAIVSAVRSPATGTVDPALLSLMCRQLATANTMRAVAHVAQQADTVLENFYRGAVREVSQKTRIFIEEELVTGTGERTAVPRSVARERYGVTDSDLAHLVRERVLRPAEHLPNYVELVHDVLVPIVVERRNERRGKTRLLARITAGLRLLLLVTVLVGLVATYLYIIENNELLENAKTLQVATERQIAAAKAEIEAKQAEVEAEKARRETAEKEKRQAKELAERERQRGIAEQQLTGQLAITRARSLVDVGRHDAAWEQLRIAGEKLGPDHPIVRALRTWFLLRINGSYPLLDSGAGETTARFHPNGDRLALVSFDSVSIWHIGKSGSGDPVCEVQLSTSRLEPRLDCRRFIRLPGPDRLLEFLWTTRANRGLLVSEDRITRLAFADDEWSVARTQYVNRLSEYVQALGEDRIVIKGREWPGLVTYDFDAGRDSGEIAEIYPWREGRPFWHRSGVLKSVPEVSCEPGKACSATWIASTHGFYRADATGVHHCTEPDECQSTGYTQPIADAMNQVLARRDDSLLLRSDGGGARLVSGAKHWDLVDFEAGLQSDVSPDGRCAAVGNAQGGIIIWRVEDDSGAAIEPTFELSHGGRQQTDVRFGRTCDHLLSTGEDGSIRLWRLAEVESSARRIAPSKPVEMKRPEATSGSLHLVDVALSGDGRVLAAAVRRRIEVREVGGSGQRIQLRSAVRSLELDEDGDTLLAVLSDGQRIWRRVDGVWQEQPQWSLPVDTAVAHLQPDGTAGYYTLYDVESKLYRFELSETGRQDHDVNGGSAWRVLDFAVTARGQAIGRHNGQRIVHFYPNGASPKEGYSLTIDEAPGGGPKRVRSGAVCPSIECDWLESVHRDLGLGADGRVIWARGDKGVSVWTSPSRRAMWVNEFWLQTAGAQAVAVAGEGSSRTLFVLASADGEARLIRHALPGLGHTAPCVSIKSICYPARATRHLSAEGTTLRCGGQPVVQAIFDDAAKRLATVSASGQLCVFHLDPAAPDQPVAPGEPVLTEALPEGSEWEKTRLEFGSEGDAATLLVLPPGGQLSGWRQAGASYESIEAPVFRLQSTSDGRHIWVDGRLELHLDAGTGQEAIVDLSAPASAVFAHPAAALAALEDGELWLWDGWQVAGTEATRLVSSSPGASPVIATGTDLLVLASEESPSEEPNDTGFLIVAGARVDGTVDVWFAEQSDATPNDIRELAPLLRLSSGLELVHTLRVETHKGQITVSGRRSSGQTADVRLALFRDRTPGLPSGVYQARPPTPDDEAPHR